MADQRQYRLGDTESGDRRPFELPGAKPHYTPDRPGQVKHIALDLTLDIPKSTNLTSMNLEQSEKNQ